MVLLHYLGSFSAWRNTCAFYLAPTLANAKNTTSCYNGINYSLFTSITHLPTQQSSISAWNARCLCRMGSLRLLQTPPDIMSEQLPRTPQKPTWLSSPSQRGGKVADSTVRKALTAEWAAGISHPWEEQQSQGWRWRWRSQAIYMLQDEDPTPACCPSEGTVLRSLLVPENTTIHGMLTQGRGEAQPHLQGEGQQNCPPQKMWRWSGPAPAHESQRLSTTFTSFPLPLPCLGVTVSLSVAHTIFFFNNYNF